jgi:hypothetical protein
LIYRSDDVVLKSGVVQLDGGNMPVKRFHPKTKTDLTKHLNMLLFSPEVAPTTPVECIVNELRRLGRDVRRAIDLLDLANELIEKQLRQQEETHERCRHADDQQHRLDRAGHRSPAA